MSSNPKTSLGVLTMAAPIVLLGAICTVATVWYTIAQVNQVHTSGTEQTTICTKTLYLQIYNGVCTRGVVNGIDPTASCMLWDDSAVWEAFDAENAAQHEVYPDSFSVTDTAAAAPKWQQLKGLALLAIPLAILNFIFCLITADADIELWDIDFDKWTLVVTTVFNLLILISFIVAIAFTEDSEITQKQTWTQYDEAYDCICKSTTSPSFGFFLMILGALFAVISLYISIYCLIRAYVWPKRDDETGLLRGNFTTVKGTDVVPAFDERDEEDDEDDDAPKRIGMVPIQGSPSSRPSSANQVAPAPSAENFAGVVLG